MDALNFLYHTIPGRVILKGLTRPGVSKLCGRFLDSDLSHFLIRPFAEKNEIRIADYEMDGVIVLTISFPGRLRRDFARLIRMKSI